VANAAAEQLLDGPRIAGEAARRQKDIRSRPADALER
jgi:hypothetical protein